MRLFVSCPKGIESLLEAELGELSGDAGILECQRGARGVHVVSKDITAVYAINYLSRLASRVLLPLSRFRCKGQEDLYAGALAIQWAAFIPEGKTIAIDANVHHAQLGHSLHAAQVVKDAICDQLRDLRGERPSIDVRNPDVQLSLFISDNWATISFDSSGAPLFHRGYRQVQGEAPIKENLAAALLRLAGYQGQEPIADPCCGSGTILMEAGMIATHTPAGYFREQWGFEYLPEFRAEEWLALRKRWDGRRKPLPPHLLIGVEQDQRVFDMCVQHLAQLNIGHQLILRCGKFQEELLRDADPLPYLVVTNPPYDRRLKHNLVDLYRDLGQWHGHLNRRSAKIWHHEQERKAAQAGQEGSFAEVLTGSESVSGPIIEKGLELLIPSRPKVRTYFLAPQDAPLEVTGHLWKRRATLRNGSIEVELIQLTGRRKGASGD